MENQIHWATNRLASIANISSLSLKHTCVAALAYSCEFEEKLEKTFDSMQFQRNMSIIFDKLFYVNI